MVLLSTSFRLALQCTLSLAPLLTSSAPLPRPTPQVQGLPGLASTIGSIPGLSGLAANLGANVPPNTVQSQRQPPPRPPSPQGSLPFLAQAPRPAGQPPMSLPRPAAQPLTTPPRPAAQPPTSPPGSHPGGNSLGPALSGLQSGLSGLQNGFSASLQAGANGIQAGVAGLQAGLSAGALQHKGKPKAPGFPGGGWLPGGLT